MAKETSGYIAPQYFYWETLEGGGKYISNDKTNYVMNQYDDGYGKYWDYPKKKVYYYGEYGDVTGWDWEYILDANGKHPTVSGSGAKLTGTSKADDIHNGGNNTNIDAGKGNDDIWNGGNNVKIIAGNNNDNIGNGGKNVNINAGSGNDYIYNDGSKVTILAGNGNDTIENKGSKVTIDAGTGKDSIINSGSKVSINATADNKGDLILNGYYDRWWYGDPVGDGGDNVTILAGSGNDTIYNYDGSKVIIEAGAGDDSIFNKSSSVLINTGDGENLVSIYGGEYITLKTGNNIDSVIVNSASVSIQSGAGKNLISLEGSKGSVSIIGGENEIFFDTGGNVVYTNDKDDSITVVNGDDNNTLNTGAGNDTVWIKETGGRSWAPFVVDTGYGNDSIRNEGEGVSINSGYGKDTVENRGQYVTIQSSDPNTATGKNLVKNHAEAVTIQGGGDSDTIKNYKTNNVSINGGRGNDVIKLYSLDSMKNIINTALTPLLKGIFDLTLVETTNGIIDTCNNVATSIVDVEKLSNVEPFYREKNQSKVRKKLKEISKETGSINDNLKKLEYALDMAGYGDNAGRINRLRNGIGKVKKIADKWLALLDVNDVASGMVKEYADSEILSTMAKEIASGFEKDEDGNLTFAWEKSSGNPATIQGGKGNDKIYGDEQASYLYEYKAGDGKDTIFNWNANDTLSISGGTYTGKIVGSDYVVTVGKGSVTFKNYTSRRRRQGYEYLPCQIDGKEANGNYHTPSNTYNQPPTPPPEGISVEGGDLTVDENFSGEINLTKSYAEHVTRVNTSKSVNTVEIIGGDNVGTIRAGKGHDRVSNTRSFTVIHTGAGKDIVLSSGDSNSIDSGADNDVIVNVGDQNSIDAGAGNDTIISDGKKNLFVVADGGNKIIYGLGATDTLQIVDDSGTYSKKIKGDDLIITADDSKITLAGAKDLKKVHIKTTKTKGRNVRNDYDNEFILGTSKADTIENNGDNVTISGGKGNDFVDDWGIGTAYVYSAGNDTIQNFNELDTIVLGSVKVNSSVRADDTVTLKLNNKKTLTLTNYWTDKVNVVSSLDDAKTWNIIKNDDSSVKVKGTSKADYIENHGDNVTISGSKGNDYVTGWGIGRAYVYSAGNDTLQDFNEFDTIVLGSVKVNSSVRTAGTVTLKLSNKKTLTMTDYWDDKVNVVNSVSDVKKINVIRNDKEGVSVKGTKQNDYIESWYEKVTIAGGSGDDTIDNNGSKTSINGGAGDDSIRTWGSDVTIEGGKGNDSLWGGDDATKFIYKYGDDNDVIYGFDDNDTLTLDGLDFTSSYKNETLTLKVTDGSITFRNFNTEVFHINIKTYRISGSKLK